MGEGVRQREEGRGSRGMGEKGRQRNGKWKYLKEFE